MNGFDQSENAETVNGSESLGRAQKMASGQQYSPLPTSENADSTMSPSNGKISIIALVSLSMLAGLAAANSRMLNEPSSHTSELDYVSKCLQGSSGPVLAGYDVVRTLNSK